MSKIYKVYAKCCYALHPIREIDEDDLRGYFDAIVDDAFSRDYIKCDWDDDKAVNAAGELAYAKVETYWFKNKILNCGDYMVIESDEEVINRPNCCGWDTDLIF